MGPYELRAPFLSDRNGGKAAARSHIVVRENTISSYLGFLRRRYFGARRLVQGEALRCRAIGIDDNAELLVCALKECISCRHVIAAWRKRDARCTSREDLSLKDDLFGFLATTRACAHGPNRKVSGIVLNAKGADTWLLWIVICLSRSTVSTIGAQGTLVVVRVVSAVVAKSIVGVFAAVGAELARTLPRRRCLAVNAMHEQWCEKNEL